MRYRLTFMERTNGFARPTEFPPDYVEIDVPDGVILDKTMVERSEPLSVHNEDAMEEDDDFLSIGEETWDYEIADGRDSEFLAAVKNSQMVIEVIPLDDAPSPLM